MKTGDIKKLAKEICNGNRYALAKGITLLESIDNEEESLELLSYCNKKKLNGITIGVSGVPGVGKSTLIESFGYFLIRRKMKVAVLALDPSSSLSGGSILGDKTRMQNLAHSPDAFVRPSPVGDTLGGVNAQTAESILLCKACGYDFILIETVGVGQSEHQVSKMVDVFLLMQSPRLGDEVQTLKKGILELANIVIINKADGEFLNHAYTLKSNLQKHMSNDKQIVLTSAIKNNGIQSLWKAINIYLVTIKKSGKFKEKRKKQLINTFELGLLYRLLRHLDKYILENEDVINYKIDISQEKKTYSQALKEILPKMKEYFID